MLEKIVAVDQIEVVESGCVQVRTKTSILETAFRSAAHSTDMLLHPAPDYSAEDARVQAICAATHTTQVIEAYKAAIAAEGV